MTTINGSLSERDVRIAKVQQLRDMGITPYVQKFHKTDMIADLITLANKEGNSLRSIDDILLSPQTHYHIAGRLMLKRISGKLSFAQIMDESGEIQLMFEYQATKIVASSKILDPRNQQPGTSNQESLTGKSFDYRFLDKMLDVGDFIGVHGELFYTHKGELTLFVSEYQLLSKAIRPLGDKFHGIGDDQERAYRQRYLDMIFNRETLERMKLRSTFLKVLRDFYEKHSFIEIETPVLGNTASGAAAAPFITHHNDFDQEMYLRISPETNLKKATVGMLERIFEVAKDFRNEGSDPSHIQEFTMIEHYAAYRNHEDNMRFTEEMFDYLFDHIPSLKKIVTVIDKQGNKKEVNFQTPRPRINYIEQIKKDSGIDVSVYGADDAERLRADILAHGHNREGLDKQATATMIDYLYKKVTRPLIVGPAFITNYPKTMQPLARQSDSNPQIVEQRQLLINGREVIKAYCELVDPQIQQANFDEQADAVAKGDDEATKGDDDFVTAMEYGMPPQSGRGMGIDRILSLLTEQTNIRDVVLFPLMKPENTLDVLSDKNKKDGLKVAVAFINKGAALLPWQEMNTIAHLNAAFGARVGKGLFMKESVQTADNTSIKLNIQHAIMIKEIADSHEMRHLIHKAQSQGLEIAEFTREMIETTNDKKVSEITKSKTYDQIEYLGVLVFGDKKIVEELTKHYKLYAGGMSAPEALREKVITSPQLLGKALHADHHFVSSARSLSEKYLSDTLLHCQQVAHLMKFFAHKLGKSEEEASYRYIIGLLHDIDRDHINKDAARHLQNDFEKMIDELDIPDTHKEQMVVDIRSHGPELTNIVPSTDIQKYLISLDELSGLMYAYARMRDGFAGMEVSGVMKRIKDKKFAAGVDRDHVRNCEKYLGISLEDFITQMIEGFQSFA